ncbi:uncharacterized protein SPAPADRAFT_51578 [Spathaspora passalidarum NRRL Y-27907]|uniref:Seipin n=1 Tax=Spathaspora passalidarum (strain NRRL Y-27907 / 11-Y1) TaxID=619300 RepID=G3AQN4_SPAPN|nr:uncharacterized protein SPAPADRAFT_51578 [Spathaspora passalidarum NRRL Y-27907]EGW31582.1 hypothetical protein SPAPADRAFT_51578 [Spathaspora passalidarum NRRL Y-27907]
MDTRPNDDSPIVDWLQFLGLVIPSQVTRSWLYFTTSASTTFLVLLPLAILQYNHYYNTLIPNSSSPVIPLNFTTNRTNYLSNYIVPRFPDFEFDSELTYIFNIDLELLCPDHNPENTLHKIYYQLNDNAGVFHQGSFILDCNPQLIYSVHNIYVPYALQSWVSPIFSSQARNHPVTLQTYELRGRELASIPQFTMKLDNNRQYLIDDNESQLRFDVKWTGFRYYLVKYYYSCFAVGTFIFFSISSGVSVLVSYALLLYNAKQS